jgi:hypothetical protein
MSVKEKLSSRITVAAIIAAIGTIGVLSALSIPLQTVNSIHQEELIGILTGLDVGVDFDDEVEEEAEQEQDAGSGENEAEVDDDLTINPDPSDPTGGIELAQRILDETEQDIDQD